ncbi:MAG: glycosyltransferase family 39 protein [Tepidisphaerales bacterium]
MPGRFALLSTLLLLAAGLAYLLGNGRAPLLDRDEPRYAITSRNMLHSGDYIVPRQYDRPRTAKPPMIYWLQAASMRLLGDTSAAARLPSALAMLTLLALLLATLRKELDDDTALLAVAVFAFAGLTGFLAKLAITDAVLTLAVAVSMACVYRYWRGDRSWAVFLVWAVATGVAGLTKGPVALALQLVTAALLGLLTRLDRRFPPKAAWTTYDAPYIAPPPARRARLHLKKYAVAAAVLAAVVLPWLIAVTWNEPSFLSRAIEHDVVRRSTRGVDGQARPPGFYLLTLFGTFFPWSVMIPAAVVLGWKQRHRPLTRFCFAWLVGGWAMFEAVTSKMVHWFLPMFLPLSVLTAQAIADCTRGLFRDFRQWSFRVGVGVWAAVTLALGLAPWWLVWKLPPTPAWVAGVLTVWAVVTAALGAVLLWRHQLRAAVAALAGSMALLFPLTFAVVLPNLWFLQLGRVVGEDLLARGAIGRGEVIMVGFREPSLAFYQGGSIREAESGDLDTTSARWATVSSTVWDRLGPDTRDRWEVLASYRGMAYADSPEVIDVHVLRRREFPPPAPSP